MTDKQKIELLREALADAIYQVTHLSTAIETHKYTPFVDRHFVEKWRKALAATTLIKEDE